MRVNLRVCFVLRSKDESADPAADDTFVMNIRKLGETLASDRESSSEVASTSADHLPRSPRSPLDLTSDNDDDPPQSSDLASACHLNEAAPVDDDYLATPIDIEDQHLGGADLEYVDPMIHELFTQNPHPIPPLTWMTTTTLVQPPAPSFQAGFNLNPHHPIDIPQHPRITSTGSGEYDQLGIAIRSIAHAAVYRNEDLGRVVVIGLVVPLTLGMLTMNTRPSPTVANLVLISTLIGFTAILNGWRFRNDYPRSANRMEQLGEALVLASFFGFLSTYLPPSLAWLPWLCWALSIAPFAHTFSTDHQSRTASGPE